MPRVSIGLPVYNGAAFLAEVLDSWRAQDFADYELVVSDNASTDATPAILAEYAARDPRLRVIRRPETVVPHRNFNELLAEASAPYFAWSAADDLRHPTYLRKMVAVLDREPDVVLAFCRMRLFGRASDAARPLVYTEPFGDEDSPFRRAVSTLRRAKKWSLAYGLARVDALKRTRLFEPTLPGAADVMLVLWLATIGKIRIVPETLFEMRTYETGERRERREDRDLLRQRVFGEPYLRAIDSMPLSPVEKRLLAREVALWVRKGEKPRRLWMKPKPARWMYLNGGRALVDAMSWYHGV